MSDLPTMPEKAPHHAEEPRPSEQKPGWLVPLTPYTRLGLAWLVGAFLGGLAGDGGSEGAKRCEAVSYAETAVIQTWRTRDAIKLEGVRRC